MALLDDIDDDALSANSALLRKVVPGYDYRSREAWSQTNKKIVEKLERELVGTKDTLQDASDACYRNDRRDDVSAITELIDDVETFTRRLRNARTGGGGLRGLTVDDESDLIAVIEHDASLVTDTEELVRRSERVRAAARSDVSITDELHACRSLLEDIERTFGRRQDHLQKLK